MRPTAVPVVAAAIATGLLALDRLDERRSPRPTLGQLDATPAAHELWPYLAYLRGQHALHYGEPAIAARPARRGRAGQLRPGR